MCCKIKIKCNGNPTQIISKYIKTLKLVNRKSRDKPCKENNEYS